MKDHPPIPPRSRGVFIFQNGHLRFRIGNVDWLVEDATGLERLYISAVGAELWDREYERLLGRWNSHRGRPGEFARISVARRNADAWRDWGRKRR